MKLIWGKKEKRIRKKPLQTKAKPQQNKCPVNTYVTAKYQQSNWVFRLSRQNREAMAGLLMSLSPSQSLSLPLQAAQPPLGLGDGCFPWQFVAALVMETIRAYYLGK